MQPTHDLTKTKLEREHCRRATRISQGLCGQCGIAPRSESRRTPGKLATLCLGCKAIHSKAAKKRESAFTEAKQARRAAMPEVTRSNYKMLVAELPDYERELFNALLTNRIAYLRCAVPELVNVSIVTCELLQVIFSAGGLQEYLQQEREHRQSLRNVYRQSYKRYVEGAEAY